MEAKLKETTIVEDWSALLSKQFNILIGPSYTANVAKVLFKGVTQCLSDIKDVTVPKAIVFKAFNGTFLAGAKIEFIKNENAPDDRSSGHWEYTWSFYEDDMDGANIIDGCNSSQLILYFTNVGSSQYGFYFESNSTAVAACALILECIIQWIKENTKEDDPSTLTLDGAFIATGKVEDGVITMGIVPDGELKLLIKDDNAIQAG